VHTAGLCAIISSTSRTHSYEQHRCDESAISQAPYSLPADYSVALTRDHLMVCMGFIFCSTVVFVISLLFPPIVATHYPTVQKGDIPPSSDSKTGADVFAQSILWPLNVCKMHNLASAHCRTVRLHRKTNEMGSETHNSL
jgi:hypothetical protein